MSHPSHLARSLADAKAVVAREAAPDDSTLYAFGLVLAFLAGCGLTMILALASRNEGLRRQLDAQPTVVVVKGGAQ